MGSFLNRLSRLEKQIGADDRELDASLVIFPPIVDPVAELRRLIDKVKARDASGDPPPRQTPEHNQAIEELRLRLKECRETLVILDSPKRPVQSETFDESPPAPDWLGPLAGPPA